jgi:hypothetical protein
LLLLFGERAFDARSLFISNLILVVALAAPYLGLGDPRLLWSYVLTQMLLFLSFVCVSRIRQRKSLFLMAIATVGSNAGWFLAAQVLASAYLSRSQGISSHETAGLLVAAVVGAVIGRLVGVQWMMSLEERWHLRTDSVGSAALQWLDAHTKWMISAALLACIAVYVTFHLVPGRDLLIVIALGFVQNAITTVNARFANRNHPGWPVITGLLAGVVFIVNWTFLIGYTESGGVMPLVLLIPYTIATVAGGNLSAFLSMAIERMLNLNADAHVVNKDLYAGVTWHKTVLLATAVGCGAYLTMSEHVLAFFGFDIHAIALPVTLPVGKELERSASLLLGGVLFLLHSITHTLSSRAGNRNNSPYHAVTCLMHGVVTFGIGTFVVLNARFLDLVPVAAFGSTLGQLFAQHWSIRIERCLGSVMDAPKPSSLNDTRTSFSTFVSARTAPGPKTNRWRRAARLPRQVDAWCAVFRLWP